MDRVELALRRYRQIVPQPAPAWEDFPVRQLLVWLSDDVCAVLEDYCNRPAFRERATWPLRALVPGAGGAERRLVDAVDAGLVKAAHSVLALAGLKRVVRNLAALNPPREVVTEEEYDLRPTGKTRVHVERRPADILHVEERQTGQIAARFWTDLVCPADYFQPVGGWMSPDTPDVQPGEFIVAFNPELHPVGDFVTRAMMRRVEGILDTLGCFRRKCLQAARKAGLSRSPRFEGEQVVWQDLTAAVAALQQVCLAGAEATLRDACITLTQTYATFGRAPDLAWLGLPAAAFEAGVPLLRHRLTHSRSPEMADRIAAALGDLRRLYEGGSPQRSAVDEAVAGGGLVLVDETKEVYWQAERIGTPWRRHRVLWKFLLALASQARVGAAVTEGDLYPDCGAASKMAMNANRLKNLLPGGLASLIRCVHGERSYRLCLERSRIHLPGKVGRPLPSLPARH